MISVVIPTRNRADLLAAALESLPGQSLGCDRFEVIVVDNGSTDHTAAVVDSFRSRLPRLRCVHDPQPGLHTGRHRGLDAAVGEVLVFADDDIVALPTWLEAVAEAFADPDVALCGGNNLPLFQQPPPAWLERLWQESEFAGGRVLPALSLIDLPGGRRDFDPNLVWGCNFAIRRAVLVAAGGFHPDALPRELIRFRGDGESHVSRQIAAQGLRCVFHPGASVFHTVTPGRMTIAYFRERGFNQGISDSYSALRHQHHDRTAVVALAPLRSWLRRLRTGLRTLVERSPAKRALMLGHAEGYAYHQRLFRSDPEVRDWVLKDSYR